MKYLFSETAAAIQRTGQDIFIFRSIWRLGSLLVSCRTASHRGNRSNTPPLLYEFRNQERCDPGKADLKGRITRPLATTRVLTTVAEVIQYGAVLSFRERNLKRYLLRVDQTFANTASTKNHGVTPTSVTDGTRAQSANDQLIAAHPFTYASFAATLPSRTVKTSTPRKCHGCPLRTLR